MKTVFVLCSLFFPFFTFCQWKESKSVDQFSQIVNTGLVTFSKGNGVGFLMENIEGDPKLFVTYNAGQNWRLKRLFF